MRVSVDIQAVEQPGPSYIKCTVWGTVAGRFGSQHVVIIPVREGVTMDDPEELIAEALTAFSAAVYHS